MENRQKKKKRENENIKQSNKKEYFHVSLINFTIQKVYLKLIKKLLTKYCIQYFSCTKIKFYIEQGRCHVHVYLILSQAFNLPHDLSY